MFGTWPTHIYSTTLNIYALAYGLYPSLPYSRTKLRASQQHSVEPSSENTHLPNCSATFCIGSLFFPYAERGSIRPYPLLLSRTETSSGQTGSRKVLFFYGVFGVAGVVSSDEVRVLTCGDLVVPSVRKGGKAAMWGLYLTIK